MKVSVICEGVAGTGGGKAVVNIANTLTEHNHSVRVYSRIGGSPEMINLLMCESRSLREIRDDADIVLALNLSSESKEAFYSLGGKKFFRVSSYVPQYEEFVRDRSIVKFATSSYVLKLAKEFDPNVKLILGPVNLKWYYREKIDRTNLVLFYSQKDGWVGIEVANILSESCPDLNVASL